jgi:N-methylhydantoinase A
VADVRKDTSRSVLSRGAGAQLAALEPVFAELEGAARAELADEGFAESAVVIERNIDARYVGQSYELSVPVAEDWRTAFHAAHRQRFGFDRQEAEVEAVTLRVTARAPVSRPETPSVQRAAGPANPTGSSRVYFDGRWNDTALFERGSLGAGHRIAGPAIVTEYSSTTWLPDGWSLEVLASGDMLLTQEDKNRQ